MEDLSSHSAGSSEKASPGISPKAFSSEEPVCQSCTSEGRKSCCPLDQSDREAGLQDRRSQREPVLSVLSQTAHLVALLWVHVWRVVVSLGSQEPLTGHRYQRASCRRVTPAAPQKPRTMPGLSPEGGDTRPSAPSCSFNPGD